MKFETSFDFAIKMDQNDELKSYRDSFHFPVDSNGNKILYFTGNSLGLQPKTTKAAVEQELDDWANFAVEGHFKAKNPWMPYHELLTNDMAVIVGAKPEEVVIMNSLTANLHFLMISFYNPTKKRFKILIESDAFPSDRFAVKSQLKLHGFDPKNDLIEWSPRSNENLLRIEDLQEIIKKNGDEIALILVGGVNYYTGQLLDLKKIAKIGHSKGCKVGIDLAHGVGNVNLKLHESGIDFAAWCTYKYLNSGPGSLGGIFVHNKHKKNKSLKRLTGWWGQNKSKRFKMREELDISNGAEGWQLSNPAILSMAAIKASLELFRKVGMNKLRMKSINLTGYLEYLILQMNNKNIDIITPKDPNQRGCQLSIKLNNSNKSLHENLRLNNVITDWRDPNVIRCAPVPFYNSYQDVYNFVKILRKLLL
ncbi:MAG: kynureninase [Flavobacteriaceae bacterium]